MINLIDATKEEIEDAAERVYADALDHLVGVQASRIALGLDMIKIRDTQLYKVLGFDSFAAFCAAPPHSGGLGLASRSRQTTIQVAERFIVELETDTTRLIQIPFSNLQTLVPVVTKENIEEVLHDALTLGNKDIRRNRDDGKYDGIERGLDAEREDAPEANEHEIRCPHCRKTVLLSSVGTGKDVSIGVALEVAQ